MPKVFTTVAALPVSVLKERLNYVVIANIVRHFEVIGNRARVQINHRFNFNYNQFYRRNSDDKMQNYEEARLQVVKCLRNISMNLGLWCGNLNLA
jgi:hypothetical protein